MAEAEEAPTAVNAIAATAAASTNFTLLVLNNFSSYVGLVLGATLAPGFGTNNAFGERRKQHEQCEIRRVMRYSPARALIRTEQAEHVCSAKRPTHAYSPHLTLSTETVNELDPSWVAILSDPARLSLLHGLCQLEAATIVELRKMCHTSDPTVRRHLEALVALGLVREEPAERDRITSGRPPKRFVLAADAADRLCALFRLLSEPLVPMPAPARRLPPGR